MDKFTAAYIECALWSSTDDDGDPLDQTYAIDEIHPDTLKVMESDCAAFQETEATALNALGSDEQNGHDFWLTRNRHGAGFWDRGYKDRNAVSIAVESSHGYGSFDLYIGDDGMIHGQ